MALLTLLMFVVCLLLVCQFRNPQNINLATDAVIVQMPTMARIVNNNGTSNLFNQIPSITVDNELECAICLDQISAGTLAKQMPSCEHIYHENCIINWFRVGHNTCPICRQQIIEMPTIQPQNGP
ncbi:hypothetical protein niasHT_027074 [Heterodera trifolii]|uniref:RING-type domain-containing protein n=1 Tax=Heterodera trifolii TaxID=157864 RepID=A0ABD2KUX8_9BILA